MRVKHSLAIALCALATAWPALRTDAATGRTLGESSVSETGEAQYRIPIVVPPGTHGMTPEISFEYSHRGAGSLLGAGWGLVGLSTISRCGHTWAQDDEVRAPNLSAEDRLCIDGQRLRLVAGTYGQDGAEYRTEIETFGRITSHGSAGTGVEYFVLEAKDGRIFEYGSTPTSRIEALGSETARVWALSTIRDRDGNSILFQYFKDQSNGSYRISAIQYTSNPGQSLSPAYEIRFVYESKPTSEIDTGYFAGSVTKETTRLNRVEVYFNNAPIRRYELTYEGSLSSAGRSRIASIRECAADESAVFDCYSPTTFSWQNGAAGFGDEIVSGALAQNSSTLTMALDINGDGVTDVAYAYNGTYWYMLGSPSGVYGNPINTGITQAGSDGLALPIDYNADGREDILAPLAGNNGTWWVIPGTATGFGAPFDTQTPVSWISSDHRALDLNGDGYQDLIWQQITHDGYDSVQARMRDPNGSFGPASIIYQLPGPGWSFGYALHRFSSRRGPDWNGDGREDYLFNIRYTEPVFEIPTNYWVQVISGSSEPISHVFDDIDSPYFVDVNGDGYTDMLYSRYDQWFYVINTGDGYSGQIPLGSASAHVRTSGVTVDWDADGNDDLLVFSHVTQTWHVFRSNGEILQPAVDTGMTGSGNPLAGDADGDGKTDLLYTVSTGGSLNLRHRLHVGPEPDLLDQATDGYGQLVNFDYVSLSQGNYSRNSDAEFPEQDYQGPMQVVSTVTASTGITSPATYSVEYWYFGARLHRQGRGFEGFYAKRTYDSRRETFAYDLFNRLFPSTGTLLGHEEYQPDNTTLISQTLNTWSSYRYGEGADSRYLPYVSDTNTKQYEAGGLYNGQLLRSIHVHQSVESSTGMVYDQTTTSTEGGSANGVQPGATYVQNVHQPLEYRIANIVHWCMGRPGQTQLTNSHDQFGGTPVIRTTNIAWDEAKCRPTSVTNEPGNAELQVATALGYDNFGNLNSQTVLGAGTSGPRQTLFEWGDTGQFPTSITNALQQQTQFEWNYRLGLLKKVRDPNGIETFFGHDDFRRITHLGRPDGTSTDWTYTDCASYGCQGSINKMLIIASERDASGTVVTDRFSYLDYLDRPIVFSTRTLSGAYNRIERVYDELGRLHHESTPCWWASCSQFWTTYSYDFLDRLTQVSAPASDTGQTSRSSHVHYEGLTTRTFDPLNKQSIKVANAVGGIARSGDHDGYYQDFDTDAFGNSIRVTDSLGNTLQTNSFDVAGHRRSYVDIDMGPLGWIYTHNSLGELVAQKDPKGQITTFEYDPLGRLTKRVEDEGTSTFTFGTSSGDHSIGRLTAISGPGYGEGFTYDHIGRVQQRTIYSEGTHQIDYSYNRLGSLDSLTYPTSTNGYRLKLKYDYQHGLLQRVKDFDTSAEFWTANATDPSGRFVDETLNNGIHTIRGFDQATGNLDYIESNSGVTVQNFNYKWDQVGNLIERRDVRQALTENFYYDNLHRLTSSTGVDPFTVTYDAMGNIASKTNVGSYTYHATRKHAVASVATSDGATSYAYDANGNMVTRGGASISWYSFNLPNTINGSAGSSQFFYGPDRSRWKQVANYGTTSEVTIYIGGLIEKVTLGGQTTWKHYIEGGAGAVAVYTRKDNGTNEISCLTHDHVDSVDSITNEDGSIATRLAYGAFGQRREANGQSGNPATCTWNEVTKTTRHGFTGHEMLDNLNLIHMNGRVYDQIIGRFISPDPLIDGWDNTQGWNPYSYVHNNPLTFTDPTGNLTVHPDEPGRTYFDPAFPELINPWFHAGRSRSDVVQYIRSLPCYLKCPRVYPTLPPGTVVAGPVNSAAMESSMRPDVRSAPSNAGLVRNLISLGVGFAPVVGSLQSVVELVSGKDYITGEKTSRVLAAVGIVAGLVGAKGIVKGGEKVFRHSDDIAAAFRKLVGRTCCFVAGTLVMTDRGLRPIEEIEVGDLVLSRDEETGETAYKPVTELIRRHDREIWELTLQVVDEDGQVATATFETTDDHPWRTEDGEWLSTLELTPGNRVQRHSGGLAIVTQVKEANRTAPTFNLEIADFHTYFVGQEGLWVHNTCWISELREYVDDLHHVFPQAKEFADLFRNIDIHKWTVRIDRGLHRDLHPEWNNRWRKFRTQNPNATEKEIYEFASNLIDEFNLPIKFERYR